MSATFEAYQRELAPTALRGPYGEAWGSALGAQKDALVDDAKAAVRVRFVPDAPSDGLARLAADRGIARVSGEAVEAWRARLVGAWESWSWLGTRYGIAASVGLLGYGTPSVWAWRTLPWDTNTTRWARLRVAFTGFSTWGAFRWGAASWGSRMVQPVESVDAATLRAQLTPMLRQWINARDRVEAVTINRGNALWGRFLWGERAHAAAVSTTFGPPAWGSSEARWGAFAYGVFC